MSIQRVLVAVDFSPCAAAVARQGGALIRQLGATGTLLHVVPKPQVPLDTEIEIRDDAGDGGTRRATVAEYLCAAAERRMPLYVQEMGEQSFAVRAVVRVGDIVELILQEARDMGAQMIVLGTRGRHGAARLMYGSVSEEVARAAEVPVVTFRSQWKTSCDARSCNWCVEGAEVSELRVDAEQAG